MGGGATAGSGGAGVGLPSAPTGPTGGGASTASKTPAKRTRYEFVIFFTWKEPVGEDTKATK
jgi:hypothetical protein